MIVGLGLLVIGAVGLVLGVLSDRTEIGAGLAEAVKGRPVEREHQ